MKGYLKFFVLNQLSRKSLTGYSIMKEVKKTYGLKLSPGSLYPLLFKLEKEGLVVVKQNKRSKTYSLTKKGRSMLSKIRTEKNKIIRRVRSIYSMLDPTQERFFKTLANKRQLIEGLSPEMTKLTITIYKKLSKDNLQLLKKKLRKFSKEVMTI